MLAFTAQVGVEKRVVALATAPEHVVRAPEAFGDPEHVLDLRSRVGKHLGIRVRCRARLEARVCEEVRGAPKQANAEALLVGESVVGERVEVRPELTETCACRGDVNVMEAVERDAKLLDELEGCSHLLARRIHRVARPSCPRPIERPGSEHVAPVRGE